MDAVQACGAEPPKQPLVALTIEPIYEHMDSSCGLLHGWAGLDYMAGLGWTATGLHSLAWLGWTIEHMD